MRFHPIRLAAAPGPSPDLPRFRPSQWPTSGNSGAPRGHGNAGCGNGGSGGDGAGSGRGDGAAPASAGTGRGNRLNLLISCASWRTDSWADALPPLLEPMGVHSLRAHTAREAERTIRQYQVHIAVVDLGLPLDCGGIGPGGAGPGGTGLRPVEGGTGLRPVSPDAEEAGPRILELLRRLDDPPPTVVIKGPRTSRDEARHLSAALRCGAFAVVDRTGANLEQMLEILRRALHRFYHDRWPT